MAVIFLFAPLIPMISKLIGRPGDADHATRFGDEEIIPTARATSASRESRSPPHGPKTQSCELGTLAADIELQTLSYYDAPLPTPSEVRLDVNTLPTNVPGSLDSALSRDFYTSASWIWPCSISPSTALLAVAILFFDKCNGEPDHYDGQGIYSITLFWFKDWGYFFISYILIGYPFTLVATLTLGLHLDRWLTLPIIWKWVLILVLGGLLHAIFMTHCVRWGPIGYVAGQSMTGYGVYFLDPSRVLRKTEQIFTSFMLWLPYAFICTAARIGTLVAEADN